MRRSKCDKKKKRDRYRKASKIGGMFLIILALAVVVYAVPTTPTLSPLNGTAFFEGDGGLICSGSVGAVGNTWYEFYTRLNNYNSSGFTNNADPQCVYGTPTNPSMLSPYNLSCLMGQSDEGYWNTDVVINNDYLHVYYELNVGAGHGVGGCEQLATLYIDANVINRQSTVGQTIFDGYIDVSDYNDDSSHLFRFEVSGGAVGGCWPTSSLTSEFYIYEMGNLYNLTQNSTSTTSDWNNETVSYLNYGWGNWTCRACDDSDGSCSPLASSNLLRRYYFVNCTSGNVALNFSLYNEESITEKLWGDFGFDLSLKDAGGSETYNFDMSNKSNVAFCLNPTGGDVSIDGTVDYVASNNASYSYNRQYYFRGDAISGEDDRNINLYSLQDSLSSSCQIIITEEGVTPNPGYYIHLDRYVTGTGNYHLASMGNTSSSGSDNFAIRLTDAWYNIRVYDGSNTSVYTSGNQHISSCPIRIQTGSGSGGDYNDSKEWFLYDNIVWSLTFNDSNNLTSLTYNSYGYTTNNCFRIEQYLLNGTGLNILNTSCSSANTGTMTHNITNAKGLYVIKYIAYQGGSWKLIDSLDIDLARYVAYYLGLDGVFLAMLLIGVLSFIGLYSPVASVMLALVGFIATRALGLITISWGAIIGIIFVGLLLLFKQKGR